MALLGMDNELLGRILLGLSQGGEQLYRTRREEEIDARRYLADIAKEERAARRISQRTNLAHERRLDVKAMDIEARERQARANRERQEERDAEAQFRRLDLERLKAKKAQSEKMDAFTRRYDSWLRGEYEPVTSIEARAFQLKLEGKGKEKTEPTDEILSFEEAKKMWSKMSELGKMEYGHDFGKFYKDTYNAIRGAQEFMKAQEGERPPVWGPVGSSVTPPAGTAPATAPTSAAPVPPMQSTGNLGIDFYNAQVAPAAVQAPAVTSETPVARSEPSPAEREALERLAIKELIAQFGADQWNSASLEQKEQAIARKITEIEEWAGPSEP